jgi:hypothetical protein
MMSICTPWPGDKRDCAAVDKVLKQFFTLENGKWVHDRCEEEIAKVSKKRKTAQVNGAAGGRPKKNPEISQEKPAGFPLGSENETQPKAPQTTDHSSVSDDTGGEPPIDLKTMVYNEGLRWLVKNTGRNEASLRSVLGKHVRDFGAGRVIEVIASAQLEGAMDPIGWMEASFRATGTSNHNPKSIMAAAAKLRAELDEVA